MPNPRTVSWAEIADAIEQLRLEMRRAVEALDSETVRRLRDPINRMRGGASEANATTADAAQLDRQRPGAMGLGRASRASSGRRDDQGAEEQPQGRPPI